MSSVPTRIPAEHEASESLLASILVARFLRSNNYHETLDTFIREAGLPSDAGLFGQSRNADGLAQSTNTADIGQWTLEGIIQEKKRFDQTLSFERHGDLGSKKDEWSLPAPSVGTIVDTPASSNLLAASVEPWQIEPIGQGTDQVASYLVATGADKRLNLFHLDVDSSVAASISGLADSPFLSYTTLRGGQYQVLTTMTGQLILVHNSEVISRRKDHSKYTVKVVAYEDASDEHVWIITAGWDMQVLIYRMLIPVSSGEELPKIGEPIGSIGLSSNPESILLVRHPESRDLTLIISRRDSTYLYYYNIEYLRSLNNPEKCIETGRQNLAPNSNAWIAFSPSCLAQDPRDPCVVSVALSTLPHMKLMIVRLLFPTSNDNGEHEGESATTQLRQSMAALALQNREDAAIMIQANTFAPQTPYSTPQAVWRPDGSGIWVNGDDGVIRGIESKTGKLVAILMGGHDAGSKVRSIWAGWVEGKETREEWLVSGGFDKKLIIWRVETSES